MGSVTEWAECPGGGICGTGCDANLHPFCIPFGTRHVVLKNVTSPPKARWIAVTPTEARLSEDRKL